MAMYAAFAAAFAAHAVASPYNAHYDRPALLDLLGPVAGLRILDAGCGPGLYAEELVARGAAVTGIDASAALVSLARERNGAGADFHVHDLREPMPWLADASFDRIVMALVLHHLDEPVATLRELNRLLVPDGHLVLSTVHPTSDWLRLGGSYFADEGLHETWHDGWDVSYRRAPLTALVSDFREAGFVVDTLVEPQPAPSMERDHPQTYRKLMHEPGFICFRLRKCTDP